MSKEEQLNLNQLIPSNSSREQVVAQAIAEYKKLFGYSLPDQESTDQAISILNLFGALTEDVEGREDET